MKKYAKWTMECYLAYDCYLGNKGNLMGRTKADNEQSLIAWQRRMDRKFPGNQTAFRFCADRA